MILCPHHAPSRALAWARACALGMLVALLLAPAQATAADAGNPTWRAAGQAAKTRFAVGANHTVAIRSDGTVMAWGDTTFGQVGAGATTGTQTTPTPVLTGPGVPLQHAIAVAAGRNHSVAIVRDPTTRVTSVYAWGANAIGQLGQGNATGPESCGGNGACSSYAVRVKTGPGATDFLVDATQVAAGEGMTAAIVLDRSTTTPRSTVMTWGDNTRGQLGLGSQGATNAPNTCTTGCSWYALPVRTSAANVLTDVTSIAVGTQHMAAVALDTSTATPRSLVYGWGSNLNGDLAQGNNTSVGCPNASNCHWYAVTAKLSGGGELTGAVEVAARGRQTFALVLDPSTSTPTSTVYAWGSAGFGQIAQGGSGSTVSAPNTCSSSCSFWPVQVKTGPLATDVLRNVSSIGAFTNGGFAIVTDPDTGESSAWGWGFSGQGILAHGAITGPNSCSGTACSWFAIRLRTGAGATAYLNDVHAIAGGQGAAFATRGDGTLAYWGKNDRSQLGDGGTGDTTYAAVGSQLVAGTRHTAVSTGCSGSVALRADGTVWAWGDNAQGFLGSGTLGGSSTTPVNVRTAAATPLTHVVAVAAGCGFAVALRVNGEVYAWGDGADGALATGATTSSAFAVPVRTTASGNPPLRGAVAIAANDRHAAAVRSDGTAWSWGRNDVGELGIGVTGPDACGAQACSRYAIRVLTAAATPLVTATAVALGPRSGYVRLADGRVAVWGDATDGRLGDGQTATNRTYATTVRNGTSTPILTGVTSLAAGTGFAVASRTDGTAWAWGANDRGQLSTGTTTASSLPAQVLSATTPTPLTGMVAVGSTGGSRAGAVLSDGTVRTWGTNDYGQAGIGSTTGPDTCATFACAWLTRTLQSGVATDMGSVALLGLGAERSTALTADGRIFTWGRFAEPCTGNTLTRATLFTPTNCAPAAPTALAQTNVADGSTITAGGWTRRGTTAGSIRLAFQATDPDWDQTLQPWVEVRPDGTGFSGTCGTASGTAGDGVASGSTAASNVPATGATLQVDIGGLAPATRYQWRACVTDAGGLASGWVAYGTLPSFGVDTAPPPVVSTLANVTSGSQPELSWTTVVDPTPGSGTAYYRVYRSASSGTLGTQVSVDGSVTSGSFTDSSAAPGNWFYTVRAVDLAGNEQTGATANQVPATAGAAPTLTIGTDVTGLALAPTSTSAADLVGSVVVTVTTTNATGYTLTAADGSDGTGAVRSGGGDSVPDHGASTPALWSAGAGGPEGLTGITVRHAPGGRLAAWGTGTNTAEADFAANRFVGVPGAVGAQLHQTSAAAPAGDAVVTTFRATPGPQTQAGTYTTSLAYTAVARP